MDIDYNIDTEVKQQKIVESISKFDSLDYEQKAKPSLTEGLSNHKVMGGG